MSKEQKIKTIKRLSRNYCEVQGDNNDCTKNPQDLIAEINTRVHDYIDVLDGKKTDFEDERDKIWAEYVKNLPEIEKYICIINYFVYLKDDELINDFSEEAINILKEAITSVEVLIDKNDYSDKDLFRYRNCLDDGHRILNK